VPGGPFYFAWAGGTIVDPVTVITVGDLTEADLVAINISNVALASLVAGLQYNVTGNGIPVGTTFIAPDPGATEIELDQAPTSTQAGALLTLHGPRTPNEPFDPDVHLRFDEQVLSFEIAQGEGDFATLTIDIKNNSAGLLATGRNLWCWLSIAGDPDPVPLFNGRLIGVPKLAVDEVVQLQFLARPDDFNVQKLNLSEEMKVLPFWDPVWLATQQNNPDTVLETYSALWHTDRLSLDVTYSDILEGEAGIVTVGEDRAFYDNFTMAFGDAPLRQVSVSGTVSWEQTGEGLVDVTGPLVSAFGKEGNTARLFAHLGSTRWKTPISGGAIIYTFNGTSVKSSWPQPGTSVGGGWEVATGVVDDPGDPDQGNSYSFCRDATAPIGYLKPISFFTQYIGPPPADEPGTDPPASDFTVFISHGVWRYRFAYNAYSIRMVLRYQANRPRTETVRAVMVADIEDLSDNAGTDSTEEISYSSDKVAEAIEPSGGIPIGGPEARTYLQTDRGAASFEYLLLAARAKLRARARSVEITFGIDFPLAIGISLRHSVALFDRRIPGGSAIGKVKQYRLTVGEDGMWGEFTMGCTIGKGLPITAAVGINAYVDDGYVDDGYQVVAGSQRMFLTDELAYQTLDQFEVVDDGLNLDHMTAGRAVKSCTVVNGTTVHLNALTPFNNVSLPKNGLSTPFDAMKKNLTKITLEMHPVTGSQYHTDFLPAISMLAIPQTIDLRAPPPDPSFWDERHSVPGSLWDGGESTWDDSALREGNGFADRYLKTRAGRPDH
jgi:hypothetical protein